MLLSFILQLTALLALGNAQSAPGNGTKPAPAAGGLVWGKATSSACPDCQAYDVCREQRGNYPMNQLSLCACMNREEQKCYEEGKCRAVPIKKRCCDGCVLGQGSSGLLKPRQAHNAHDDRPTRPKTPAPKRATCGSRGLPNCRAGERCIRLPGATCGPEADCGGYCVAEWRGHILTSDAGLDAEQDQPKVDTTIVARVADPSTSIARPAAQACSATQACPDGGVCTGGTCMGKACFMRSQKAEDHCPDGQVCVQSSKKMLENGQPLVLTDVRGRCAMASMKCGTKKPGAPGPCKQGWFCARPNGDPTFPCHSEGDKTCDGLCMIFG